MVRIVAVALVAMAAFDWYAFHGEHVRAVGKVALAVLQRLVG
jgi:hypothetical protein